MSAEKYTAVAARWSDEQYADSTTYLRRRAELIAELGVPLVPGDTVLDLACGDGGVAEFLLPRGLSYVGVDANEAMIAAARRRLEGRGRVALADLNEFEPDAPVAATTLFRALYYTHDRAAFFRRAAGFTERKLVFDVNPRQYRLEEVLRELRESGFERVATRPFFVPQRISLPASAASLARIVERSGPLARMALRFRFTIVVAAQR